jgi:hypothetical protein
MRRFGMSLPPEGERLLEEIAEDMQNSGEMAHPPTVSDVVLHALKECRKHTHRHTRKSKPKGTARGKIKTTGVDADIMDYRQRDNAKSQETP